LSTAKARKFGLTVGPAFLLLSGVLVWRGRYPAAIVTGSLGGILILLALVAPRVLGPVERVWMGLAHAMSSVTTPIIMGLIYFLVLTPVGAVMRAFGRNPLVHAPAAGTNWIARKDEKRVSGMDRQF
jgi:hypothetical protein